MDLPFLLPAIHPVLLLAAALVLLPLLMRSAWVLSQRFDSSLLRVQPLPPWEGAAPQADTAMLAALQHWCREGAGPARRPWWRPWGAPVLQQPLAVALWLDPEARHAATLEAACRSLDGTHLLEARSTAAGLWLRLRVKLNDVCWWRTRQADDPWDCGYLNYSPGHRAQLRAFQPRRATLIVLDPLLSLALPELVAVLLEQAPRAHALRLLVQGPMEWEGPLVRACQAAGLPLQVFWLGPTDSEPSTFSNPAGLLDDDADFDGGARGFAPTLPGEMDEAGPGPARGFAPTQPAEL